MKKLVVSLSALLLSSAGAWAAGHAAAAPRAAAASAVPSAAAASAELPTMAEVRKIDKANKKITLKHGEIKNLDMPPMTMVFQLNDSAQAEQLKAGDKVRFSADKQGSNYIVTRIEKQ